MMMEVVYFDEEGKILQFGSNVSRSEVEATCQNTGLAWLVCDKAGFDIEKRYVKDGAIVRLPDKPTPHHVFNYRSKQWEDPRTPETEWPLVRAKRNALLSASDWTQLPDVPLATKETWATYRQALRDITNQADPFNIVWPEVIT